MRFDIADMMLLQEAPGSSRQLGRIVEPEVISFAIQDYDRGSLIQWNILETAQHACEQSYERRLAATLHPGYKQALVEQVPRLSRVEEGERSGVCFNKAKRQTCFCHAASFSEFIVVGEP